MQLADMGAQKDLGNMTGLDHTIVGTEYFTDDTGKFLVLRSFYK